MWFLTGTFIPVYLYFNVCVCISIAIAFGTEEEVSKLRKKLKL